MPDGSKLKYIAGIPYLPTRHVRVRRHPWPFGRGADGLGMWVGVALLVLAWIVGIVLGITTLGSAALR
jgi:hypothetical protein